MELYTKGNIGERVRPPYRVGQAAAVIRVDLVRTSFHVGPGRIDPLRALMGVHFESVPAGPTYSETGAKLFIKLNTEVDPAFVLVLVIVLIIVSDL